MIAQFNLVTYPRFILSGETEEEFLWDLFDQLVYNNHTQITPSLYIPNEDLNITSSEDRIKHRWSEQWCLEQSSYFINKITDGISLPQVIIPPNNIFVLHVASTLAVVMNRTFNSKSYLVKLKYVNTKYPKECPEKIEWLNKISEYDYPYKDLSGINLINYMLIKGVLVVNEYSQRLDGILSDKEVEYFKNKSLEELDFYKKL